MSSQERNSRLQKLSNLKDKGINPFPNRYKPLNNSKEIKDNFKDEDTEWNVNIAGRIMLVRDFGKACFITVKDSLGDIQIYGQKNELNENYNVFKKLDAGDIIGAEGTVFRTKKGEITINVKKFVVLAKAINPLPEKYHGLTDVEMRYRQRYTDLIVNDEVKEAFYLRAKTLKFIREFLSKKDFIEVETPMLQQIPGGANARPFETYHNALGIPLFLRIAPELYLKRLIVGGMEKVFELSRVFRNEGISTKHNPEFTLLEVYEAYNDYTGMLELTEEILNGLVKELFDSEEIEYQGKKISFKRPFAKMTMKDAIEKFAGINIDEYKNKEKELLKIAKENKVVIKGKPTYWKIVNTIFEDLVEDKLEGPVFITHYPAETTPLAKQDPENPDYVERFELFIVGREHANAYSELNDPIRQKENFQKQVEAKTGGDDEAMYMDEDFVNALEMGMPPTGGLGIGIDRLVMLLIDSPSIRDTILFPQMKPKNSGIPSKWKNTIDTINKFSHVFTELVIKKFLEKSNEKYDDAIVTEIINKNVKKSKYVVLSKIISEIMGEPGEDEKSDIIKNLIDKTVNEDKVDIEKYLNKIIEELK